MLVLRWRAYGSPNQADFGLLADPALAVAPTAAGLFGVWLRGVWPPSLLLADEGLPAPCLPLLLFLNSARRGAGAGFGADAAVAVVPAFGLGNLRL